MTRVLTWKIKTESSVENNTPTLNCYIQDPSSKINPKTDSHGEA